jgi:hypothetical protein
MAIKLIITLAVAVFYLNVLFTAWNDFADLQRLALVFLVASFFVGMLLSLAPFKRRYLDTYQVTCFAPFICFISNVGVDLVIKSAAAGVRSGAAKKVLAGVGGQPDGESIIMVLLINFAFLAVFGVLFGASAVLGCYCGYELRVPFAKGACIRNYASGFIRGGCHPWRALGRCGNHCGRRHRVCGNGCRSDSMSTQTILFMTAEALDKFRQQLLAGRLGAN